MGLKQNKQEKKESNKEKEEKEYEKSENKENTNVEKIQKENEELKNSNNNFNNKNNTNINLLKTISLGLFKKNVYNNRANIFISCKDNNIYIAYGVTSLDLECYDVLNDNKFIIIKQLHNIPFDSCRYSYDELISKKKKVKYY